MKLAPVVAKHVEEVLKGNWTDIFLVDVISDISFEEAVAKPAGIDNSIAMLLHHIGYYNDVVLERLQGIVNVPDASNGFAVTITTSEGWQNLKENVVASFKKLSAFVKEMPDERLWEIIGDKDTAYKELHGIAEHGHYHLGQIVLIKKIIRNTKASA